MPGLKTPPAVAPPLNKFRRGGVADRLLSWILNDGYKSAEFPTDLKKEDFFQYMEETAPHLMAEFDAEFVKNFVGAVFAKIRACTPESAKKPGGFKPGDVCPDGFGYLVESPNPDLLVCNGCGCTVKRG